MKVETRQARSGRRGRPKGLPKTGGRKRGTANKVTADVRQAAQALLGHTTYVKTLTKRLNSGKIAPAVETMIWHYAHGKPKESVALDATVTHKPAQAMTTAELEAELLAIAQKAIAPTP